jgi:menaquinone-dependent protoporphyrinogen oxidase
MNVLITAATRHGSTMQIARIIGAILQDRGIDTDIVEPDSVSSLADYDGVVLGSAVYMGRWLEPARQVIGRCSGDFVGRTVWLFSSGPLGEPAKPHGEPVDVERMRAATGAIDHKVFPGRLVKAELRLAEKVVAGGVHAPEGDFRSWDDVVTWALGIADFLRTVALANALDIPAPDSGGGLTVSRKRGPSCAPRTRQPALVARG